MTTPKPPSSRGASDCTLEGLLDRASADNHVGHLYTQILTTHALRRKAALGAHGTGFWWGLTVSIKDNIDLRGVDTSCGRRLPSRPAASSAVIVDLLEALGAVIIGKTNLDEAALGATGRNARFGRCVNPRFEGRLSGGSSSGAAASVATGHARLGIGTDTLGSVRIPAAFCGVSAFKPSHGRLPTTGVAPLYPRFDTVGLLAGSLRDLQAAALPLLDNGSVAPDAPVPGTIAVLDDAALAEVDCDVGRAYRRCVTALREDAGWQTVPAVAIDWADTARTAWWEVVQDFADCSTHGCRGYPGLDDIQGDLRRVLERALVRSPGRRLDARRSLEAAATRMREGVAAAAILTPTCPHPAPPVDAELPRNIAAFVAPANVAGLPAVSWPQWMGGREFLSLQLIGRFGDDLRLLEQATHLAHRLDGVFGR